MWSLAPHALCYWILGCTWRWYLPSQALCYWVLAVYMEVVPVVSSTVLLGTGDVHGGGPCPLKYCVFGYCRVHGGGPCRLKHCVTGYLVSPADAEDVPQAAHVQRSWVFVFVSSAVSTTDGLLEFVGFSLSDMVSF